MNALPLLPVGIVISIIVGYLAADRVGRALGARRMVGFGLVVAVGLIVSATLTPLRSALEDGATGGVTCDFARLGPAPLSSLLALNDTSLNVLLFLPLGAMLALVPPSRARLAAVLAAIALPFAIETMQMLVPLLDRGCQSADVVDNLMGLVVGFGLGALAARLMPSVARRPA